MRIFDIVSMYTSGLLELIFAALGFAVLGTVVMKALSVALGGDIASADFLLFLWQSLVFVALWPGQTFWTIERATSCGRRHSIIGVPTEDDLVLQNHQMARRIRNQARE